MGRLSYAVGFAAVHLPSSFWREANQEHHVQDRNPAETFLPARCRRVASKMLGVWTASYDRYLTRHFFGTAVEIIVWILTSLRQLPQKFLKNVLSLSQMFFFQNLKIMRAKFCTK